MRTFVARFPFTIAAFAGILLSYLVTKYGVRYDSGGGGSILFYFALLLQFPVLIAHELVHGILALKFNNHGNVLVISIGLFFAALIDLALFHGVGRFKKAKSKRKNDPKSIS